MLTVQQRSVVSRIFNTHQYDLMASIIDGSLRVRETESELNNEDRFVVDYLLIGGSSTCEFSSNVMRAVILTRSYARRATSAALSCGSKLGCSVYMKALPKNG